MKKTYVKPEMDTRTFAQFENVFTACSKTKNNTPPGSDCQYCDVIYNPGGDSNLCPVCGQGPDQHSNTPPHPMGGTGS